MLSCLPGRRRRCGPWPRRTRCTCRGAGRKSRRSCEHCCEIVANIVAWSPGGGGWGARSQWRACPGAWCWACGGSALSRTAAGSGHTRGTEVKYIYTSIFASLLHKTVYWSPSVQNCRVQCASIQFAYQHQHQPRHIFRCCSTLAGQKLSAYLEYPVTVKDEDGSAVQWQCSANITWHSVFSPKRDWNREAMFFLNA